MDLSRFIGPPLIGTMVATALWGMTCMQTVVYFLTYKQDRWPLKALITTLFLLDSLHEVFCFNALWQTLIPHFGAASAVATLNSDFIWQGAVSCIVSLISRLFFTWRIWLFSNKNWIFPLVLVPPSIADTVESLIFAVQGAGKAADKIAGTSRHLFIALLILVTTDIVIVVTMCILLWRRRTGVPTTDRLIMRLMSASVTTGAWTAIFGVLGAILLAVWPNDFLDPLAQFPICPLYCNAVLGNLNSRRYITGSNTLHDDFSGSRPGERRTLPIRFGTWFSSRSESRNVRSDSKLEGDHGVHVELHVRSRAI